MFPDLSYILHYLFGTQPDNWTSIVKTFGLFLVFAFLSSAFFLYLELKRKEEEGLFQAKTIEIEVGKPASIQELIVNAIIGFLLGFKGVYAYQNFAEFQQDAAGVLLSGKGVFWGGLLGALIIGGIKFWEKHRERLDKPIKKRLTVHAYDHIGDITIVAAISGIIGAKLFAVFEDMETLMNDPLGVLLSGSGMAIYGGLIVAFVVVYIYVKRLGLKPIHVMDAVAPALMVGYGVGRMGCHFSGDGDWGIPNTAETPSWWIFPDWAWAYDYPNNVLNQTRGNVIEGCEFLYCNRLAEPVWPTPIYEIIMAFIIVAILWSLRKRIKIPGMLFFIYLIFNGFERFWIEKIRVNAKYDWGFIQPTQAEVISTLLFLTGVIGCFVLWRKNKALSN